MSVRAIDVGFNLKGEVSVNLSRCPAWESVPYDGADGKPRVAVGTNDQIALELAAAGYDVITARRMNGREVRVEARKPTVFITQAPRDNYWVEFPSTAAALASVGE